MTRSNHAHAATRCDARRLEDYLADELSAGELAALESHLSDCAACRQGLADLAAPRDVWEQASHLLPPDAIDEEFSHISQSGSVSGKAIATDVAGSDLARGVLAALAPTDDPRMLGRLGAYEIVGVVGCGGMGVVLKGFDRSLDRYVAIKVLAPHLATSGAAKRRFAREAQAAAAVVHPNVVAIHGVDELNALPFLVMPYVAGPSLEKRLVTQGPLETAEILRIATQVAAGLAAAHAQGLVHRDIKPANVLLEQGVERVLITDFGLARAADDASLTYTGVIAGTPQYMSPEQAEGAAVDYRSDLFSLGSLIYRMATGRPPFRAETTLGVLRRIADSSPRPIREINGDVPAWLDAVVMKLLAKKPEDRFASAAEVAELLEQCLKHVQQPLAAALPEELPRWKPPRRSRPLWRQTRVGLAAGAAAAIVLAAVALLLQNREPAPSGADSATPSATTAGAAAGVSGDGAASNTTASGRGEETIPPSATVWDDQVAAELEKLERDVERLERESQPLLADPATDEQ